MNLRDVAHRRAAGLDAGEEIGPKLLDVFIVGLMHRGRLVLNRVLRVGRIECPPVLPTHVQCPLLAVEVTADALALLGVVRGELAMLPAHAEALEFERGELMIGSIRRLLGFGEHGWAFDGPAAGRKQFARPFFLGDPENLVHPVDAPITKRAVGVVEVFAKAARVDATAPGIRREIEWAIERTQRCWAAPQLPIQLLGRFDVLTRRLRTTAVMDKRANHPKLAQFAGTDEITGRQAMRRYAPVRAHLNHA